MNIAENIFKSYDIRGIYPQELNEENAGVIANAIYKFFLRKKNSDNVSVVLGRDMRISSPALFKVVKDVLVDSGARVIDAGLVSTPSFYYAVYRYGYDAGIQISASHNPKEYNGFKIVVNSDNGLIKIGKSTGMDEIKRMSLNGERVESKQKGTVEKKENILNDEIISALEAVGNSQLNKYTIVADPANAMGATYIEALFQTIPANLIKMNFELDGTFPAHQPDPLQADTLVDLQKKVIKEKADMGLAPDGDGDRLFFIDEKGAVIPGSFITALIGRELLNQGKGEKILFDIRYTMTPQTIIEENGGIPVVTKVGHAFITEKLHETGGIFAGESSSHFYYRINGNAEWQIPTILFVLKVMSSENKKLSEIIEELRRSYESGEVNFKVSNTEEIMSAVKEKYADGQLSTLDGVAVSYPDWRLSLRSSNTEPLMRLNVEAVREPLMRKKQDELVKQIQSLAKYG